MGKFIITVLAALFVSQPCFGQVDLGASKLTIDAFERGRRLKADEANSQAQRELARAQAELLKAQTEALRQPQVPQVEPVYTEQEVKAGLLRLTQRHPDWREYEQRMANEALVPVKGLSAYDYVLALYLLEKEKTAEEQQAAAQAKMLTDVLQQRPDLEQYLPAMVKLAEVFVPKEGESEAAYLARLYDLAKQAK